MTDSRPNIIFIMSDDHASHAMSCYGSRINTTPHLDRIASGGMRFDNCFCTNSICTPSRAVILTGTHCHINGVTTLASKLNNQLMTFPKLLRAFGYQTAIFGKWHLGEGADCCPTGFDDWAVVPGQGKYFDPDFLFKGPRGGESRVVKGYATDIITDMSLDWLARRDASRPFMLLCHHKAPHRPWQYDDKHAHMFDGKDVPEPDTFNDDYSNRAAAAAAARMRIGRDMVYQDYRVEIPPGASEQEKKKLIYQGYIKNYLRCIASIDDNTGRLLDYLDANGLADNTIVVYTSDQGFFLGDHGWYDKRFMYEESLRMPLIIRYPREIKPRTVNKDMVVNIDFAPTFLDFAGIPVPEEFQGTSFRELLNGRTPDGWQTSMYYRYWMHGADHNVAAHYGIRTLRYKLIYYYSDGCGQPGATGPFHSWPDMQPFDSNIPREWELFDLQKDPAELNNVYRDAAYAGVVAELKAELRRQMQRVGDKPYQHETE